MALDPHFKQDLSNFANLSEKTATPREIFACANKLFKHTSTNEAQRVGFVAAVLPSIPEVAKQDERVADDLVNLLFKAKISTDNLLSLFTEVATYGYVARGITDRLLEREGVERDGFTCNLFAIRPPLPGTESRVLVAHPTPGTFVTTTYNGLATLPEDHILSLRHEIANARPFQAVVQQRKKAAALA